MLDDVPLDIDPGDIRLEPWDEEEVRKLFTSLEFRTLHERLKDLKIHASPATPPALELKTMAELSSEEDLRQGESVAFAWSEEWLALCDGPGEAHILPFSSGMHRLGSFFKDANRRKIAHDAKPLYRSALAAGAEIQGLYCDTKIAAYLLEPGSTSGYAVKDTVNRYLKISIDEDQGESQAGEQTSLALSADDKRRVCREAVAVRALAPALEAQLRNQGIWELAITLEFPLVEVLARMEHNGILVDRGYLEKLNGEFGQKMATLEGTIQQLAGENFKVNSQPQLQRILFEKLGLPKTRRIKTGYSTDAAELEKIADAHPVVASLLEYPGGLKAQDRFYRNAVGTHRSEDESNPHDL